MASSDYISELGALALASRLRRLLHRLHADGELVYQTLNMNFKTKWFPVLHLLMDRSPLALTEIARLAGVSHPSMIQTIHDLTMERLLQTRKSDLDGRLRELSLTDKGRRLCLELRPIWDAFRTAGEEVNTEGGNDFLNAVGRLERSLDQLSLYDRIMTRLEAGEEQNRKRSRNRGVR